MGLLKEDNLKEIMKVAEIAGKEYAIEQALDKMRTEWENLQLTVVPYRETGTYLIKVGFYLE
jgi:dynein heavy chain